MKKHHLLHALSEADEQLVERAANSMTPRPKAFGTVRFLRIGAVAASLALILAVGAVALPLMRSQGSVNDPESPAIPESAQSNTHNTLTETSPEGMIHAPISIMYLTSEDHPKKNESIMDSETQDSFWSNNVALMTFDCPEGETITVRTFWESLSVRAYPSDGHETWEGLDATNPEDRKTYIDILSTFHFGGHPLSKRELTLNVTAEYLVWEYDTDRYSEPMRGDLNYYLKRAESYRLKFGEDSAKYKEALAEYQKRYDAIYGDDYNDLQLDANQDILSYVTRNADGEVTGVGAVYVCRKHLIEDTENSYYADTYISRYTDLGYVRFDTPMTEEEAEAELKKLYETIPEAKSAMDFTPVSDQEYYKAGLADLLNTVTFEAPENHYTTSGFGGSSADNFRTFHVGWVSKDEDVIDGSHYDRIFRIYSDGTWEEIIENSSETD